MICGHGRPKSDSEVQENKGGRKGSEGEESLRKRKRTMRKSSRMEKSRTRKKVRGNEEGK